MLTLLVHAVRAIAVDLRDPAAPTSTAVRTRQTGLAASVERDVPHQAGHRIVLKRTNEARRSDVHLGTGFGRRK